MQVVQHNIASQFTNRQLNIVTGKKAKSTEKLSSGYKINRSADDAAGLAISEKMRWQIRGLNRASENIQDGISFVQTGEGALNEVHSMLQRIRELAVQASNDTNTDQDRAAIDEEIQQIKKDTQRVFDDTMFNNTYIFRAPYLPDIETPPNDYKFFNIGNSTTVGGIMVNNKRYTWDELGVPQNPSTEWNKEFTDDNGELIRLKLNAGDDRTQLRRVYELDANDQGILINNLLAATWDDTIHQDGDKYSFTYHGMDISFTADAGASRQDVISHLKPDGISGITWDAVATGQSGSKAVASDSDNMVLNVTKTNKNNVEGYQFQITANDTGVTMSVNDPTALKSGTIQQTDWNEFTDLNTTNGGTYNILDWGTESPNPVGGNPGGNPITLDDTAIYHFKDTTQWDGISDTLDFDFSFVIDEVSKAEAITGLTQTLSSAAISAPIASVTDASGTVDVTGFSGITFHFQRDQLLRDFGANGSDAPMTTTVVREKVTDGSTFDAYEQRKVLQEAYARWTTDESTRTITYTGTVEVNAGSYDNTTFSETNRSTSDWTTREKSASYELLTNQDLTNTSATGTTSSSPSEYVQIGDTWIADGKTYATVSYIVTETKENSYYKTNSSGTQTYVKNGSDYNGINSSLYAYDESGYDVNNIGNTSWRDNNSKVYHIAGTSDSSSQKYVSNSTSDVLDKTYEYNYYKYTMYVNYGSAGQTAIMSGQSDRFIDTGRDTTITDSAADYAQDTSMGAVNASSTLGAENVDNTISVHGYIKLNSGSTNWVNRSIATDQATRNITLAGADAEGTPASVTMRYRDQTDENGELNKQETVTFTPRGNATATFTKGTRVAGDASSTNLKVQMNPPEKLLHIQAGALGFQDIPLRWNALTNTIVGISGARTLDYGQSQAAIQLADDAIGYISDIRAKFGAYQNRLEYAYSIDQNTSENTSAAESRIRDTDMAKEMVDYSKHDILAQAGQAMLSQANQQPQGILSLLQ